MELTRFSVIQQFNNMQTNDKALMLEAAVIKAIGIENLTNKKEEKFSDKNWSDKVSHVLFLIHIQIYIYIYIYRNLPPIKNPKCPIINFPMFLAFSSTKKIYLLGTPYM